MWTKLSDLDQMLQVMDLFQNRINRLHPEYARLRAIPAWDIAQGGPKTNLYDEGDYLTMRVEVPGVARENLSVKIQGNYLEISGSRKSDAPEGYTAHRVERAAKTFTRSLTLPSDVDTGKVEAQMADGLLILTLPKLEAAKPKQVTIN